MDYWQLNTATIKDIYPLPLISELHDQVSGARWFKDRLIEQEEALHFVDFLLNSPIQRICLENPIGIISTHIRKPDQIIQPWMFGHNETKAICLWLKNLPKLTPTKIMSERLAFVHHAAPSPYRWKTRSRTFQGIADAMASQWGSIRPWLGWRLLRKWD